MIRKGDTIGSETTFRRDRVLIVNEGRVGTNEYIWCPRIIKLLDTRSTFLIHKN